MDGWRLDFKGGNLIPEHNVLFHLLYVIIVVCGDFLGGLVVKNPTANADGGLIPSLKGRLEKGVAAHSSVSAWRIPWTEESGRLQSTGLPKS